MEVSQEGLALLLFASVAAGYLFGLFYDFFGFIPKIFKCKKAAVFICDFLFCVAAGVALALIIYRFNDGKFRLALPLGVIGGIIIYKFTLRKLILRVSCAISVLILKFIGVIIKPIRKLRSALAARREKKKSKREEQNDKKKSGHTDIGVSPHGRRRRVGGEPDAVQQTEKGYRKLSKKTLGT